MGRIKNEKMKKNKLSPTESIVKQYIELLRRDRENTQKDIIKKIKDSYIIEDEKLKRTGRYRIKKLVLKIWDIIEEEKLTK